MIPRAASKFTLFLFPIVGKPHIEFFTRALQVFTLQTSNPCNSMRLAAAGERSV